MCISEPLPQYMELEYHDEVWQQPMDYEHIPFTCRRCHEYGHLFKQFPLNTGEEIARKDEEERGRMEEIEGANEGFWEI